MGYTARNCAVCGRQYTPTYGAQRGCSRVCGQSFHPHAGNGTRACIVCGSDYRYTYSAQRTCGRACGAKINSGYANRVRTNWPCSKISYGECPRCAAVFVTAGPKTYCSRECRSADALDARRAAKAWGNPRQPPRPCPGCQAHTIAHPRRRCDECVTAAHRARKTRGKRRRRAAKLGVRSEPYTLSEIAERDDYRCGLCGQPVASLCPWPRRCRTPRPPPWTTSSLWLAAATTRERTCNSRISYVTAPRVTECLNTLPSRGRGGGHDGNLGAPSHPVTTRAFFVVPRSAVFGGGVCCAPDEETCRSGG